MWLLLVVFMVREVMMIVMGMMVIHKSDAINGAKWYGKLNTVVLYSVMLLLILFPTMPTTLAHVLITLCVAVILFSLVLYACFYRKFLRDTKNRTDFDS